MGKLKHIGGGLAALPPRLARQSDGEGHSKAEHWRGWYSLVRWKSLRARVFKRDGYRCRMRGCGVFIADPKLRIADHIEPHRGDPALFWDDENVQTLCKPCHDSAKQREERRRS